MRDKPLWLDWQPYTGLSQPTMPGEYLVTISDGTVRIARWSNEKGWAAGYTTVLAWHKLPEPYEPPMSDAERLQRLRQLLLGNGFALPTEVVRLLR